MTLQKTRLKKLFIVILIAAFLFKLSIFVFGALRVPGSIFDPDSETYLLTAKTISAQGVFGVQEANGAISYEAFRTPGYPVFLAVVHQFLKIPLSGVIFIQLLLTMLAGLIVYKIAVEIDYRAGILSMAIALFDPPTSVYSLKIMTEALYIPVLFLFIYMFIRYLKSGKIKFIVFSAVPLIVATYVRPISYYLGAAAAMFMLYANIPQNLKKTALHALVLLAIVFSFLGIWQLRNYYRVKDSSFATIAKANLQNYGLAAGVKKNNNLSVISKSMDYLGAASGSLINLMTLPGSLKYYNLKFFAKFGKVIFYAWMGFWLIGFLAGCAKIRQNIYYQFLLWVMLYFIAVIVINISSAAGERFRIPLVACIAVISSSGWLMIRDFWAKRKNV